MDNRYYENVIKEMKPLFDEQQFTLCDDGTYKNEKRAVRVSYDDKSQSYVLEMAQIKDGETGDYAVVSSWLFDDSQTEADAESVGMDFTETVRENIGAKLLKKVSAEVELPTVSKGEAYNVTAFTKKMLDVFPQFKDSYKEYVAKYENFLYLDFFGRYIVPQIKGVYLAGDKKEMKKLCDALNAGYVAGDKEAVNTMVAVLAAAVMTDQRAKDNFCESFKDNTHLIASVENFIPMLSKNARLKNMLIK